MTYGRSTQSKRYSGRWLRFVAGFCVFSATLSILMTFQWSTKASASAVLPPECAQTSFTYLCQDVSQDLPYGSSYSGTGGDASGRVISVVVDPSNPQHLFSASDKAGVWTSTDGGQKWGQASNGLLSGFSAGFGAAGSGTGGGHDRGRVHPLAIDETNPQRLLYATLDDDGRPVDNVSGRHPFGGLYVSTNGAGSWQHVDLPCSGPGDGPGIAGVVFSGGLGFVLTSCGLYTSSTALSTWTPTRSPFTSNSSDGRPKGGAIAAAGMPGENQTLYGCGEIPGSSPPQVNVYRSSDSGNLWKGTDVVSFVKPSINPDSTAPDPDACLDLAIVPDDPSNQVLVMDMDTDVWLANFATGNLTLLGFRKPNDSGTKAVVAALRGNPAPGTPSQPGITYDVLASDGYGFTEYDPFAGDPTKAFPAELPSEATFNAGTAVMHPDTWGIAVPPGYDPANSNCTAYVANDGGVYKNAFSQAGQLCRTSDGPWVRAHSGLHVGSVEDLNGVSQATSCSLIHACPALYVAEDDNGTWGTVNGGNTWSEMGCCGDSHAVRIDPALPNQMVTTRNGCKDVFVSSSPASGPSDDQGNMSITSDPPLPLMPDGTAVPQEGDLAQVITPPDDKNPPAHGDYFTVQVTTANDQILRNLNPSYPNGKCGNKAPSATSAGWTAVSSNFFASGSVQELQASGGHSSPTLYALTSDGKIYKGQVDGSGTVPPAPAPGSWGLTANGISASNVFADPYDTNVLYASDGGSSKIVASGDGGGSWTSEDDLTRLATGSGEFSFSSIYDMTFVRSQPEIRVAALGRTGVAFSRDSGRDWIPLLGATSPIDVAVATVYDSQPNPATGTPSVYIGLRGRGVERVDAPFPTLEAINVDLTGLTAGSATNFVDDTTGVTTPLRADSDGNYRGTELIDMSVTTSINYHLVVNGLSGVELTHAISQAEQSAGVVSLPFQATTTALSSSPDPSADGQTVTLTATVGPGCNGFPCAPPGRTVTFSDESGMIGLSSASGASSQGSTFVFPTSQLPPGDHTVTATYLGDYGYAPSISPPTTQQVNPPIIVSVSPSTVPANGTAFTLSVSGLNFVSISVVQWNGSPRTTTYLNSTQLAAAIPASDVATSAQLATAVVAVQTPSPLATSIPVPVTITGNEVGAASSGIAIPSGSASASTAPTTAGGSGVTAALTNNSTANETLTVATYNTDPTPTPGFNSGGFMDLRVPGATSADTVSASFYYSSAIKDPSDASLRLTYYTGSGWAPVVSDCLPTCPSGVPPTNNTADNLDGTTSGGKFAVIFGPNSQPSITQLSGTVFNTVRVPGTWHPTASMHTARESQTATLLAKGKILVAGGNACLAFCQTATAELYYPATATWQTTGSMHTARSGHSAILLKSGKVLVAGGVTCSSSGGCAQTKAAELYDPASGTWSLTGSMAAFQAGFTTTLLANGKVLIAGGYTCNPPNAPVCHYTAAAQLYDTAKGTWTLTGSLGTARSGHQAVLLPTGKVLVAGGGTSTELASAELYDPAKGTWSPTGAMHDPRVSFSMTLLATGQVLAASGENFCNTQTCTDTPTAELYDPAGGTWTLTGSLATARDRFTTTALANGTVLVAGGESSACLTSTTDCVPRSAEIYNPTSGTWAPTDLMTTPRFIQTATLLTNGTVLAAGGISTCTTTTCTVTPTAELYTPAS